VGHGKEKEEKRREWGGEEEAIQPKEPQAKESDRQDEKPKGTNEARRPGERAMGAKVRASTEKGFGKKKERGENERGSEPKC
jgi:hypothetical protein